MSRKTTIVLLLLALSAGCGPKSGSSDGKPLWIATTGHIYDALTRISAGTDVEIKLLCGPGIDPHSYAASPGDVKAMANADAIFFNGFHLEAKLHDLLTDQFANKTTAPQKRKTTRLEQIK